MLRWRLHHWVYQSRSEHRLILTVLLSLLDLHSLSPNYLLTVKNIYHTVLIMYITLFYCNAISLSNNYRGTIIYVGCWQHRNCFPVTLFNQVDTREIVQKLFNSFLHHIHSLLQVSVQLQKTKVWKPLIRYTCKEIPKVQRYERIIPLQCLTTLSFPDPCHDTYHSLLDEAVYIWDKTSS